MSSLIKADFKKLFKGKSFWICSLITLVLGIGLTFLYHAVYDMLASKLNDMGMSPMIAMMGGMSAILSDFPASTWATVQILFSDTTIILLLCIVMVLFITTEYTAGTYKNSIARGFSRTTIYFSKLIISLVVMLILTVLYIVPSAFTANALYESTESVEISTIITTIFIDVLELVSITILLTMLAFVLNSTGGAIALTLFLMAIVPTILEIVDILTEDLKLSQYWLPSTLSLTSSFISNNTTWIPVTISLCYLAASLSIGLLVFNKKDIK